MFFKEEAILNGWISLINSAFVLSLTPKSVVFSYFMFDGTLTKRYVSDTIFQIWWKWWVFEFKTTCDMVRDRKKISTSATRLLL